MKKCIGLLTCLLFLSIFIGCSKNLYFGTNTSVGLSVSGTTKIPNKVSFAYDREEIAIVPDDSNGNAHSVFAALDSEWTWTNGFINNQLFATGQAADEVSKESLVTVNYDPKDSKTADKPLIFTTGMQLGIGINFGQTAEAPASLLVGYRRAEMTLMPDVSGKKQLDSVFADISINSVKDENLETLDSPRLGGVRIKQRFATGLAAVNASENTDARKKLRKAVYGDPVLDELAKAKTRFEKEASLQSKFKKMKAPEQSAYLLSLNETFGKKAPDDIRVDNFQVEIGKLNSTQFNVAVNQIQSF